MGSKRENVMLAYPVDDKKLSKMPDVVIYQRKLNGERARVEWHGDEPIIFSSCNNEMPFFTQVKKELKLQGLHGINFDGEMYCHGMPREEIHSICSRRTNPSTEENKLAFNIFDIITPELNQLRRIKHLIGCGLENSEYLLRVESTLTGKEHLISFADQFIREGYEGVVIRHPGAFYTPRKCNYMLKYKPTESDTYPIIGWEEEQDIYGYPKGRLGSVLVKDSDGHIFSVGTGKALDAAGRDYWWERRDKLTKSICQATVKHSTIMTVNGFPTCTSLLSIEIKEQ